MGLLDRFRKAEERQNYPLSLDTWFSYLGQTYPITGISQTLQGKQEEIRSDFIGLTVGAMGTNGVVFACMQVRAALLSEARFQFQGMRNGRPGDLYGTPALRPLENPWPTATTGDLIVRADQDVSLAGNSFGVRLGDKIKRLRPDWVTLVLDGENGDPDTELIGIVYQPGGPGDPREPKSYLASQVYHYAPTPDPLASYRGMSWITPIIREIQADNQATKHKEQSFVNGATPNMKVNFGDAVKTLEKFEAYKKKFSDEHAGAANAAKTLFLAAGMDATVIGQNFQQMDFKALQGAAETRIAAASQVHPVVVALSEGLQGSSLNAGNFQAAARLTGDKFLRPWWRGFAGSVANVIDVPGGSRLWYDDRDIAFLQADVTDAANVQQIQAITIKQLIDGGFEPETVVAAVMANDWALLSHTNLFSVQLQPPMPDGPPQPAALPAPEPKALEAASKRTDEVNTQLAFALQGVAHAIERRPPDVVHVEPPAVTVNPGEVTVFNKNIEDDDLRSFAAAIKPAEINVELDEVAKMIGEVEARRILDAEKAQELAAAAADEAEKRHRELIEELKPLPPAKMVRHVKRDENGLIEVIVDEPESADG